MCKLPALLCIMSKIAVSESKSLKDATSGVKFGNSQEMENVFNVHSVLLKSSNKKEKNLDNLCLVEVAQTHGMNFVLLRWWPVREEFDPQK